MSESREKLYNALSQKYDLGTFEEFNQKIDNEDSRKKLYDAVQNDFDLGSYEEYSSKLGFGSTPAPADTLGTTTIQAAPMEEVKQPRRGFKAGAQESWKGLSAGAQFAYGEVANAITGSSQDDANALYELDNMLKEGKDVDAELDKAWTNAGIELRTGALEFLPGWAIKGLKQRVHDKAENSRVLNDIREAIGEANGDVAKAREILAARAQEKSYGDIQKEKAQEKFGTIEETEGFGAWVGENAIQMIPSASALIVGALTKSPAAARAIGMIGMGGMTAATSGSSMYEARESGASDYETHKVGVVDGAIEYITEKLPFDNYTNWMVGKAKSKVTRDLAKALKGNSAMKGELEDLLKAANKELGGKLFSKKSLSAYVADMLAEGASEFTAEATQTMTKLLYEDAEMFPLLSEAVGNGMQGALAGFFMGAVLGGASKTMEHHQNKQRRKDQGYVDVAVVNFGTAEKPAYDVVEILSVSDDTNLATVLQDGAVVEVNKNAIGQGYRYSYEEFEAGRMKVLESEAIENGAVTKGMVLAADDRAVAAESALSDALRNEGFNDEEIIALLEKAATDKQEIFASDELAGAYEDYREAVKRSRQLRVASANQAQTERGLKRLEIEEKTGEFWRDNKTEDANGNPIFNPTVETGLLQDGTRVYILSDVNEAGECAAVTENGEKKVIKAEMLQDGTRIATLDDYLQSLVDADKTTREQTRMSEQTQQRVNDTKAQALPGTSINFGTAEDPRMGTIVQNTPDGAMVQMEDGSVRRVTWDELANTLNIGSQVLTDDEIAGVEAADILGAESAFKGQIATSATEIGEAAEETSIAAETMEQVSPLPTKADGTVDQNALWNQDPQRWAEWNDEQKQDGGANSLAYIDGAIAKESARIAELQAQYAVESDFDTRDAIDREVATIRERLEQLIALQQKYAVPIVETTEAAPEATIEAAPEAAVETPMVEEINPVKQTLRDLYNDPELSESEIEDYINANVQESQKVLDKHLGKAPKMGTDMAKYKAEKAKHQEKTAELEKQRDFWREVQSYIEVPTSEMDMEPQNALEFTAKELTRKDGVKLQRDSFTRHTGYGSEAGNFLSMLRTKQNGGLTLEEAGERLMEMDRENGTGFFDQSDPNAGLNAILEVIGGARTSGDVSGYIKANREQMAREEVAAARNAMMEEMVQPEVEIVDNLEEDLPEDIFYSISETTGSGTAENVKAWADAWSKRLGIAVTVLDNVNDVTDAAARNAIAGGAKVAGWFNAEDGKVYIYAPNASTAEEVSKTFIHEVVSHKGLRGLLGKKGFNDLCDLIWSAMSPEAKAKYLTYENVLTKARLAEYNANPEAFEPTAKERRAAADEFIARRSESINADKNAWQKMIDSVKRFINKMTGKYSIDQYLDDLLESSLARYETIAKKDLKGVVEEGQTYGGIIDTETGAKIDPSSDIQAEGNVSFRAKDGSLVGMHNISEDKLRKAIKQGGLANPSTAVVNIAEYSLEGYGDISLIMPSSLVDSETGDNAGTYTGDAWTPTYPTISRQLGDAGWKLVKDRIRAAVGESDDLYRDIVNSVDNYLSDDRNSRLEFVFLKEKGIEPKIEMKGADGYVGLRNLEAILGFEGLRDSMESYEKYKAASPMAKRSFNMWQRVGGEKKAHKALKDEIRQYPQFAKLMGLDEDLTFAGFDSFTYSIFRKEYDAGNVNTIDTLGGASRYVDANDMRTEFEMWLESLMEEAGAKEVFFAGWTRDGDRIYKDNTLENVSRYMRMQGRTNAYNDHGLSATKSALLQRLTSLAEIRKNRARLKDESSYNKSYDELKDRLFSVISQLADMEKISNNPFMNIDYAEARLQEAIVKRNPISYLNNEYGYSIDPKGEYAEELKSFIKDVQKMPAKYFETKFERPVYLNEFAAAVMPNNTSEGVKQALTEAGLPIFEYDSAVEGARREATLKATEEEGVRFRILGEMGAANLDAAEEATTRLDNLDVARQMEEAGKDAKTIRLATGWERGVDNLWRYEVPDEYDLANLEKRLQEELDNGVAKTWGIVYPSDLGDLINEYPDFNVDIMVWVGDEFENTGEYSPATEGDENTFGRSASIEVKAKTVADIKSVLVHEIQHVIQEKEGFAEGGNAFGLKDKLSAELDKRVERIKELRAEGRDAEADELMSMSKGLAEAVINNEDDAYGNYRKLAGEVEARNASARLGMTMQERREVLLSETEDVAREDQVILMEGLGVNHMADGNGGIRLTSSNASIARFDKVNGTDVRGFIDFLKNDKEFVPGKPTVFHIANAGDLLGQFGIKGKFMVGQFTFSRTHTVNADHELGVKEWIDVINNLNNPIAITSYKGQPNQFRIYTYATINGRNICVGVNVSTKDGSIELANIISAYGRDIQNLLGNESVFLLYPATIQELKQKISQVSTAHNSLLNATSSALSADKGSNNFGESNTRFRITPEMDAEYLRAVEAGDMETVAKMVAEAVKLAMPNTTVVDENGYPREVYRVDEYRGNRNKYTNVYGGVFYADTEEYFDHSDTGHKKENAEPFYINTEGFFDPMSEITGLMVNSWADILGKKSEFEKYDIEDESDTDRGFYNDGEEVMTTSTDGLALAAQRMGYKGVILRDIPQRNGNDFTEYAVFNSNAIKSAKLVTYDDNGNVIPLSERFNPENADIRFRVTNENQAIFVSNAAKAVEGIKQEKATPEQWLKMIEKNGGLKAGEDKWMGLSDWLKASDKKTLTKQEVLDFINENMIIIEEQHYSEDENALDGKRQEIQEALQGFFDEYVAESEDMNDDMFMKTHYDYAIQKLADELGYTAFNAPFINNNALVELDFYEDDLDTLHELNNKLGLEKYDGTRDINDTRLSYTTEGLTDKHEIALVVPTIESWNESDDIHFGDAGDGRAVAWIRFGDAMKLLGTTEVDGKKKFNWAKVLVIDEIQSKRHQEGREQGYSMTKEEYQKRLDSLETEAGDRLKRRTELLRTLKEKYGEDFRAYLKLENTAYVPNESVMSPEEVQEWYETSQEEINDAIDALKKEKRAGIPDAPFDKNWHELAMKRMLRYAAENGYDVIAWTKGEQQAERYNIGGTISEIKSTKYPRGYEVVSFGNNGNIVHNEVFADESAMAGVYGKEMAQRIIERVDALEPSETATISGDNLRIGGEGMKGFYDKMVPAFMNKYGKKWGVKVEDINLPGLANGLTMHSVPVTEEMKASVMEGQVMFRVRGENESAMDFHQSMIDAFLAKYEPNAEVKLYPINRETAKEMGVTIDELKKIRGMYLSDEDIIAIFANEEETNGEEVENSLFHESIHKLANFYPYMIDAGKWLWDNASMGSALTKHKDMIEQAYANAPEAARYEEMLAWMLGSCMEEGCVDILASGMPANERDIIEQITNEIGYDIERESIQRTGRKTVESKEPGKAEETRGESAGEGKNLGEEIRFRTSEITPEVRAEMDTIAATAIVNGNYMKAPNGADTNLTSEQWAMVRTKNFIDWFGDWINDPENASKVVDENGEPMVVYHGTAGEITEFEDQQRSPGFWFVDREDVANGYAESASEEFGDEKNIVPAFLNIRNPRTEDAHGEFPAEFSLKSYVENDNGVYQEFDTYEEAEAYQKENVPDGWVGASKVGDQHDLVERAAELGHDGVIMKGMHDQAAYAETRVNGTQTNFVVFNASQIKTASENTGEFSKKSDDIRFKVVTDTAKIEELEDGPKVEAYRAVQIDKNGRIYSPMASRLKSTKKGTKQATNEAAQMNQWDQAVESLDKVDENGKITILDEDGGTTKVSYNPYGHCCINSMMNDQFKRAWERDGLYVMKVLAPESELTAGYHAEKAKDAVGIHKWKTGAVGNKLPENKRREILLTRWMKNVKVMPWEEVAQDWIKTLEGENIDVPFNVVPRKILNMLAEAGVKIVAPEKGMENAAKAYEQWLADPKGYVGNTELPDHVKSLNEETDDDGPDNEPRFRTTGTPTEAVVAEGLNLSPAQTAELAGNIFAALPEESRKKITDGLNGNILGLQDAILQIPTSLALKENWNDEDRAIAQIVSDEVTKMVGQDMTRPFSAPEALWMLYNALNKSTDLISAASRALVQSNLGFDAETLARLEEAKEGVRFRTVGDASVNAAASLYNRGSVNVWTRLKESYVDSNASVEKLVKAIERRSGKVAEGFENILLALNQQSSKGLAAMKDYENKYLNPMLKAIRDIMDKTDFKYEDIVRHVILKHGLERNKKLAQRDARAHYQEIYDDIITKINGMTAAQKRTYLTNAQLRDADAKAELASLQSVDPSILTEEQKAEHKRDLAKARKAVKETEEYLKRAKKIATLSEQEAQDELDKIFEKIEDGTDSVYKELRKNDYSGISSMFYDQLGVDRKNYSTEEQYQSALMAAKADKYSTLADVEAAAAAEVSAFEGKADTKELWKRINAATKRTLRQQYEANMISKDQYASLRDMFEYYVPLRGFKDNTAEDMYTYYRRPNSTGYTKPILGAEGRKTEAESPFGWIASMAGSAIASNVKNEAKLALYYFVSNRPENGIATLSRTWFVDSGEVDGDGRKIFKPAYPPFSESLSSDEGKAQYEMWQANMRELQKEGKAYESGQRLNLGNAVVNISEANRPEHIVNVKVAGKDYTIIINGNPRAAQAINGDLNIEKTAQDYGLVFGPVLRWMSSVNTSYNPEFWITNFMRDFAFTAMAVTTKEDPAYQRKFFKNYAKAFKVVKMVYQNEKGTIGDSYLENMYKDFVKYGSVTGYTQIKGNEEWEKEIANYLKSNDPESVRSGKIMKGTRDVFQAMHQFGESLEQVSRFAAFLTSREMGKDIYEAVNDAKEITVNFNRKGSGKMITLEEAKTLTDKNGQPLNQFEQWMAVGLSSIAPLGRRFIMFFNAAIQGLNATYKLWDKNPKRFAGWALAYFAVGLMNAVLHAMMDDDDDYLDIPAYERRNSLMLGGNGAYLKWALPQEARAFYALGDLAVETAMGRVPQKFYEPGGELGQALSIVTEVLPVNPSEGWKAFMPSIAIPFIELALNEDYKGSPIYNEQKWLTEEEREKSAKWSKAYQNTGKLYTGTARVLNAATGGDKHDAGLINLQPEKMEHLVQSAFGGTIRTADKFINTFMAIVDPEEDWSVRQTPFLNRVLTINDERFRNVYVNEVFDYYKADAEHALSLEKQYIKDRDAKSLDDLRRSDEYQWAKIYGKYKKPLKSIQEKLKVADGTAERKELMKRQDELKKQMIKEISEL